MVAIFVLSAFILILLADHLVLKLQGRTHPAFEPAPGIISITVEPEINYELPSNIFLSKGHTWLKRGDDGLTAIGVDLLGSRALGGLSIIKCPEENARIKRGDVLFVGNYGSETVEFLSPINGIVSHINKKIIGNKILNPYDTWGLKLNSEDNVESEKEFFAGTKAVEWIKGEFQKLTRFLEKHNAKELVGETMFDGGSLSVNSNTAPDKLLVNNFKKEFLSI